MNKRKKSVIDHAKALFVERGIQQTSIQDIIDRAGISKGTFYNYFSSKNECVEAILIQSREDIKINRTKLQLGKESTELEVLIQQIVLLSQVNVQQGISGLFEEIMHSGDHELKKIVLNLRLSEVNWLANRFIEVYGQALEPYAIEAAVLYYGMYQHLLFTSKITNHGHSIVDKIAYSVFHHMQIIIKHLIEDGVAVLDQDKLVLYKTIISQQQVKLEDLITSFNELIEQNQLTDAQYQLADVLLHELSRESLRHHIISALLDPFLKAFVSTSLYDEAIELMEKTWNYMTQVKQ